MLVKKCICDRCGKEFPENDSKTIMISDAKRFRKSLEANGIESKVLSSFTNLLNRLRTRDYCPECVAAFKKFLNMKEGEVE